MRRVIAHVRLNELHTLKVELPPWELPVMQSVHAEPVKVIGEARCNLRVPDVTTEYERLSVKYGVHRDTRQPNIQSVYPNEAALAAAMEEDLQEQAAFDAEEAARAAAEAAKGDPRADGAVSEAVSEEQVSTRRGRSRAS